MLPKHARNRDGALELLDFLTSPAAYEAAAADWGITPPMPALYTQPSVSSLPNAATIKCSMGFAQPYPVTPASGAVVNAIGKGVTAALRGELTPAEALKDASAEVNAALAAAQPGETS